jgi:phosphonate transport system substrate-binding protein
MKKLLLTFGIATLLACSFPAIQLSVQSTPPGSAPAATDYTPTRQPTPGPGAPENPLILALAPSAVPEAGMVSAGEKLAAQLQSLTGYTIVTVAPNSEQALIDSLGKNNAHVAVLSPYANLLARDLGLGTAALASLKDNTPLYGAQFIAHRDSEFEPFYDELTGLNTAEAAEALAQFDTKKPCWSDETSASGYVVPLGYLKDNGINGRAGAFLAGQPSVVRAVYAEDICDFGATYVDARTSPALEDSYPDVLEKVVVIWKIPPTIPYETVFFSKVMPIEMRRVFLRAFMDVMNTVEGKSAMQTVYGIEALQPAEDPLYSEFDFYVKASGLDPSELVQ